MSQREMPASQRYVKLNFNEEEIRVIRAACTSVALHESYLMMEDTADADLETAANQARKAGNAAMAEGLASLFKAGQDVLIEPEDLALVLDSLKAYGGCPPEAHAQVVKNLIEKIEQSCRR